MEASIKNFIARPFHLDRLTFDFYSHVAVRHEDEGSLWTFYIHRAIFQMDLNTGRNRNGLFSDS